MDRLTLTEKQIQDQILKTLQVICKPSQFWRQNSGMRISEYTNKKTGTTGKHVFKAGPTGISDIMGVYKGIPIAIEVKRPKKKPTDEQWAFLREHARAGGLSIVACCIGDVRTALNIHLGKEAQGTLYDGNTQTVEDYPTPLAKRSSITMKTVVEPSLALERNE